MIRSIKSRPRLIISAIIGIVLWCVIPHEFKPTSRILVAWDIATGLYLILTFWMMNHSNHEQISCRSAEQDEGRFMILALTTFTALASLAAIVAELSTAKDLTGTVKYEHIALAGVTVFLSWTFLQTMYALHYAHEFYIDRKGKPLEGLEFPGKFHTPDYWDFVYYSFIIGTACATADINITSSMIRRITTVHCILAFFFNTTILALTVNIGASLF